MSDFEFKANKYKKKYLSLKYQLKGGDGNEVRIQELKSLLDDLHSNKNKVKEQIKNLMDQFDSVNNQIRTLNREKLDVLDKHSETPSTKQLFSLHALPLYLHALPPRVNEINRELVELNRTFEEIRRNLNDSNVELTVTIFNINSYENELKSLEK